MFKELGSKLKEKIKNHRVIDHIVEYYSNSYFYDRDIFCSNIIWDNFDKSISNILIVGGNIPILYLNKFKDYNLTFIDNNPSLFYIKDYIKEKYNCEVIYENPITYDLSNLIKENDLIIYPETETLVPFYLLKYKQKNKMIFCCNFLRYDYKINNNLAYSEEDLIDMCNIFKVLLRGSKLCHQSEKYSRNFYYVMGNAD